MQIWKSECPYPGTQAYIQLPKNAEIVRVDNGYFWYKVSVGSEMVKRDFATIATGESYNDEEWEYLGTWDIADNTLVWHLLGERLRADRYDNRVRIINT